jgi:ATP:ADP antiporter, AAA family
MNLQRVGGAICGRRIGVTGLLTLNVFLLMAIYYILKTVREALILTQGGAEVKSYSAMAQALILLLVVPVYSALASRVKRAALIAWVTLFFAANLALFYGLEHAGVKTGVIFFIWLGIFSVMLTAQFWALANDLLTEEQGKRCFPVIGLGGAFGALAGSAAAKGIFRLLDVSQILLLSAALLLVSIAVTCAIDRQACHHNPVQADLSRQPIGGAGAFHMVLRNRYFLLIALLIVLANVVNTMGEFVLGRMAIQKAYAALGSHCSAALREQYIGSFYANYFVCGSLLGLLLQFLLVARVLRWLGVSRSLLILPGISLVGYGLLALIPGLSAARITKIAENSMDYTLEKTALNALFSRTSRAAKYKAKTAIDTFFYRAGDLVQALLVGTGSYLAFSVRNYAVVNVICALLWMGVALAVDSEHRKLLARRMDAAEPAGN